MVLHFAAEISRESFTEEMCGSHGGTVGVSVEAEEPEEPPMGIIWR